MKKLFTLTLALLVAAAGYSQVRSMSKNDARKAVATEKVAIGNEVMQKLITGNWDEDIIVKKPGSAVTEEEFSFEGEAGAEYGQLMRRTR